MRRLVPILLAVLCTETAPPGQDPPAVAAKRPTATLQVGGSARLLGLLRDHAAALQPALGLRDVTSGPRDGLDHLRAGRVDLCLSTRPIRPAEARAFAAADVAFVELPIGHQSVTLVHHRDDRFLDSLTTDQLTSALSAGTEQHWVEIDRDWPDLPITVLLRRDTDPGRDLLRARLLGTAALRGSPLAFTGTRPIVEQLLEQSGTLFWLPTTALDTLDDPRVRVVAIDGGRGPIRPDPATIWHGLYPLARPLFIYLRREALDDAEHGADLERLARAVLRGDERSFRDAQLLAPSRDVLTATRDRLTRRTTGSLFVTADYTPIEGSLSRLLRAAEKPGTGGRP